MVPGANLLHKVANGLLQVIDPISHFINSANYRGRHLIKPLLLLRPLFSRVGGKGGEGDGSYKNVRYHLFKQILNEDGQVLCVLRDLTGSTLGFVNVRHISLESDTYRGDCVSSRSFEPKLHGKG
jgi:hypothetical protein